MNERIKELRKTLKLTQQGFADHLGVKRNTVAQWEIGINNLSDQITKSICREFSVSETWLRTGEGGMFVPTSSGALDRLAQEYKLSAGMYILIKRLLALKPENQQAVVDFAVKVAEDLSAITCPETIAVAPTSGAIGQVRTEPDTSVQRQADIQKTEGQKKSTPGIEGGLDDSEESFMEYVQSLTPGQQRALLEQGLRMTGQQKEPSTASDLATVDDKLPEFGPPTQS